MKKGPLSSPAQNQQRKTAAKSAASRATQPPPQPLRAPTNSKPTAQQQKAAPSGGTSAVSSPVTANAPRSQSAVVNPKSTAATASAPSKRIPGQSPQRTPSRRTPSTTKGAVSPPIATLALEKRQTAAGAVASARGRVTKSGGMSPAVLQAKGCVDYVDVVSTSLSHRVRSVPEPTIQSPRNKNSPREGGNAVPLSLTALASSSSVLAHPTAKSSSSLTVVDETQLLPQIQRAANGVLHWFHALEIRKHPDGATTFADAHKNIGMLCQDLSSAVSALQMELSGSNADKTVAQYIAMNIKVFDDCRASIEQLYSSATSLMAVRTAVQARDVEKAAQLVAEAKAAAAGGGATSSRGGGRGQAGSSLLVWLERQWMPAMQEWKQIRDSSVEAVSVSRSREEVDSVLNKVRAEVITRSSSISEILLPGETLTDLVTSQIEKPLDTRCAQLEVKDESVAKLSEAVRNVDYKSLASLIREVERHRGLNENDLELKKRAEQMLIDVQLVAKVTVRFTSATKASDPFIIIDALHSANELMQSMHLEVNQTQCDHVINTGRQLLAAAAELAEHGDLEGRKALALRIDPADLSVEHIPNGAWAPELSEIYTRAIERLSTVLQQAKIAAEVHEARKSLVNESGDYQQSPHTAATPSSPNGAPSADHIRSIVKRSREFGIGSSSQTDLQALEGFLREQDELQLKVHFSSNIRITALQSGKSLSFDDAKDALAEFCGVSSPTEKAGFRIRYQDVDGDHISVLNNDDWALMIRDCQRCTQSQRMELYCDVQAVPQPTPTKQPSASRLTTPQNRQIPQSPSLHQRPPSPGKAGKAGGHSAAMLQALGLTPTSHKPPTPNIGNLKKARVPTKIPDVFSSPPPRAPPIADIGSNATEEEDSGVTRVVDLEPEAEAVQVPRASTWEIESNLDLHTVASTETHNLQEQKAQEARKNALTRLEAHQRKQEQNRKEVTKSLQVLQQMRHHPAKKGGAGAAAGGSRTNSNAGGAAPGLAVVGHSGRK